MIKLLIADDEAFIRQGIRQTIHWKEHGIEIVGEASNGADALKVSVETHPDIVLTDIQMPIMNGIELAKKLNEILPQTQVIILTAFGNTDNFSQAIEARVNSFLLKSANSTQILNSVLKAKKDVLESRNESEQNIAVRNIFEENQELIRSTLLIRYLNKDISVDFFSKKAKELNITLDGPYYSILLAKCVCNQDWQATNRFHQVFNRYRPVVIWPSEKLLAIIMNTQTGGIEPEEMDTYLPELAPYVFGNSVVLMNNIEVPEEIPICYGLLKNVLDACFWNTLDRYTIVTQTDKFSNEVIPDIYPFEVRVVATILSHQFPETQKALQEYYDMMQNHRIPRNVFLESATRLLILIQAMSGKNEDITKLIEIMEETETPIEMIEMLLSMLTPPGENDFKNEQFSQVLKYIEQNYNSDIKLSDVAKAVHISTGHLSRIFKAETGFSFKEWVNRLRIEKAKELIIASDLKYYEIAELVGYKDYKYFSAYFNKFCCCSAKEYKQRYRQVL